MGQIQGAISNDLVHHLNMDDDENDNENDNENKENKDPATDDSLEQSQQLLIRAGQAALEMPRLETMEIWQTCTTEEAIFRYESQPQPTVTFLSRFDMEPMWTKEAQDVWERVAKENAFGKLVVRFEDLPPHPGDFEGCHYIFGTIRHLKLQELVIDPVSLYAAVWEENPARKPRFRSVNLFRTSERDTRVSESYD